MERKDYIEVDLSAIAHNTRVMREHLSPDTALMAVVKADAYGHGAVPVAKTALASGASALAVAIPEEGEQLRAAGIDAPILILGGIEPDAAEAVVRNRLIQTVFDTRTLDALSQAAGRLGMSAQVHIKLDTGMSRIGVRDEPGVRALTRAAMAAPGVVLCGAFTHFATADADDAASVAATQAQIARFERLCAVIREEAPQAQLTLHCCNSAGIFRYPQAHHDMARGGITLYGYPPAPGIAGIPALRPAMRWVTAGVLVKELPAGAAVSYGATFVADRPMRVMTVPVGYADGYRRALSNGVGSVLVRGRRAKVLGRVCMDQIMVDVTDIPGAQAGDEVVLLGRQGEEEISAQEMADWLGTISYEVLLAPSVRVPRVYKP